MFRSVALLVIVFVATVAATNVRRCKNNKPFPLSVVIEGCETMPCDVIKGTTAIMNAQFVGTRDNIKSISARVMATAAFITVPYELSAEIADVCSNLLNGATCPIDKGEDVIYGLRFPVESYYPEIKVKVEVSLVDDETNESVACFIADIKVKKGSAPTLLSN